MTRRATIGLLVAMQAGLIVACASSPAAQTPVAGTPTSAPAVASPAATPDFGHPNRSCKVDADCEVKDVGNCCGTYPMCVNKDAAVDPKAVRAQCANDRRVGMCHVMAVAGCSCVQGQCSDNNAGPLPARH